MAWRAFVNMAMDIRFPWNVEKFLSGLATGSFSRRTHVSEVSCSFFLIEFISSWKLSITVTQIIQQGYNIVFALV
jgi:hypothetical protein